MTSPESAASRGREAPGDPGERPLDEAPLDAVDGGWGRDAPLLRQQAGHRLPGHDEPEFPPGYNFR